jgi:tetratricopeptide (TPR) repeat protein
MDPVIGQGIQAASSPEMRAQAQRRRRILAGTVAAVVLAAAGGGGYVYFSRKPTEDADHFKAGMGAMAPGRYKQAITEFDQALMLAPARTDVFLPRAQANDYVGNTDAALTDYQHAIDANPRLAEAYTGRGSIYRKRGDLTKALSDFTKALEIKDDSDTFFERAQVYEAMGDLPKAIKDLDSVVARLRDAPHVLRARSALKLKVGDKAGGAADLARAQELEARGAQQSTRPN